MDNMNEALLTMFLAAIQPAYKKSTKRNLIGRVSQNFWDVFDMFLTKYGKVKPMDLKANRDWMTAEWYPAVPIETLFGRIEDACEYASFSNRNIPKEELIHTGEVLLLKTGHFGQEYKDWRSVENADRNWDYFQEWWQEAYDLREETTTAVDHFGFSDNVQSRSEHKEDPQEVDYNNTVENFGTAFAANSTAFSQLTQSNQNLGINILSGI